MFFLGMGPYQYGTTKTEIDRTTPRQVGQPNQELPSMVAFRDLGNHTNPDRLQLTGEEREQR